MKYTKYIVGAALLATGFLAYRRQYVSATDIVKTLPHNTTVPAYPTRAETDIDTIIVHHSATPVTQTATDFANYHISEHNWAGIGYHYVITAQGQVQQTEYDTTLSIHTIGYNKRGIAICLVGDFTHTPPTDVQMSKLKRLIRMLRNRYGIRKLVSHREVNPYDTDCPGTLINMNKLREDLGMIK